MKSPPPLTPASWQTPTRRDAAAFWVRAWGLRLRRIWCNLRDPSLRRRPASDTLADAALLAEVREPLWSNGHDKDFALIAGKVQNLRVARAALDSVVVPAGGCLSFWQQVGRPLASRGYVVGREVRAGCVVPTIGGGLCQITNALATCAQRAGLELVERHGHSVRLHRADTTNHADIDATVFWNYVDLRVRSPAAWRIEIELTDREFVLRLRGEAGAHARAASPSPRAWQRIEPAPAAARNCLTCDETACFRHRPVLRNVQGRCVLLLDAWTPEFAQYVAGHHSTADRYSPVPARFWRKPAAPDWGPPPEDLRLLRLYAASVRRTIWQRLCARRQRCRQASLIAGQRWLAQAYAQQLRAEHTELLIDQALLPHLQLAGVLGGRTYDVLMPALPMAEIERRLDRATTSNVSSGAKSLRDFRVDPLVARAELEALRHARRIVTPHADVASFMRAMEAPEVVELDWHLPAMQPSPHDPHPEAGSQPLVVFVASALARKGAYELADALRGLLCRLRILGTPSDDATLWHGIDVEYSGYRSDWAQHARVAVLPAYVEHAPRAALRALAAGVPVIATPACGLSRVRGVTEVPSGDAAALRVALLAALFEQPDNCTVAASK